ncbi:MAG: hypothetical protein PHW00_02895 [Clostridia bacterium]|nr:hypothetical protein [Clostridia bacterium]
MKRFNQAGASRQRNIQRVTEKYTEFVTQTAVERVPGEYARGRQLFREVPDAKFVIVEKPPKKVYVEPAIGLQVEREENESADIILQVAEQQLADEQVEESDVNADKNDNEDLIVATEIVKPVNAQRKSKQLQPIATIEVPREEQIIDQEKLSINKPVRSNPLAERVEKPVKPRIKKSKVEIYVPVDNDPIVDTPQPSERTGKSTNKQAHAVELEELLIVNQPLEELLEVVLDEGKPKSNKTE